ncbi:MAG: hypothetical protein AB9Q22_12750 [Candidatus Reddybacter sp.]
MKDIFFSKITKDKTGLARIIVALSFSFITFLIPVAQAHHVLGRPAYSLNEDSNTPPSMNIETLVGDFFVTAMVFPAFPKPEESGRINLYVTRLGSKQPLNADIEFSVRNDGWFNSKPEQLGAQVLDDNVYRQAFSFHQRGDYIISASFWDKGEHYIIDFPLRVGEPLPIGPLGIIVTLVLLLLIVVTMVQHKKIRRNKARDEISARSNSQLP